MMRPDRADLISKEEAFWRIDEAWKLELGIEDIPLQDCAGRVLASDLAARFDLPICRASGMDGIAVKLAAFENGMPDTASWVRGVDYAFADTGDDFDDAFDAVIPIELVEVLDEGGVKLRELPKPKMMSGSVRSIGSLVTKGAVVGRAGSVVDARAMAAIALGGYASAPVLRKPKVAFIPTGSELVSMGETPRRGQNIDTNSVLVRQMLLDMGAEPLMFDIVRDDKAALENVLDEALAQADIVLLNAGTSKGGEDYCARILEERGEVLFQGVAMAPGRPMNAALVGKKLVVNVSGPALAAFYSVDFLVRRVVCSALGVSVPERERVDVVLDTQMHMPPISFLTSFSLRRLPDGKYAGKSLMMRGPRAEGTLAVLQAEGLMYTEGEEGMLHAGDTVSVELLVNRSAIPAASGD